MDLVTEFCKPRSAIFNWKSRTAIVASLTTGIIAFGQILGAVLLSLETYALFAHFTSMFGFPSLPTSLVNDRRQFLVLDSLGVVACMVLPNKLWWLAVMFHARQLYLLVLWRKSGVKVSTMAF